MNPAFDVYRNKSEFQSLDGLRCLSILAVIWHHSGSSNNAWHALNMGFLGVDLFFVISGFLIVTLLLRERAATGGISLRKFYIRRTLRIFPLYYGLILSMVLIYCTVNTHSPFGQGLVRDLPYYLTFTADFVPVGLGIVWSLAAEEQFYLLWPSLERYLSKIVIPLLVVLILFNQLINFSQGKSAISAAVGSADWSQLSIFQTTFTPILLGVGAAHLLHDARGYKLAGYLTGSGWASAFWCIALVVLMTVMPQDISGWPRLALQLCMAALVISCVYREDHALASLLISSTMQRIGRVSYGIYLFHVLIIGLLIQVLHLHPGENHNLLFPVAVMATFVTADLSFRFFESPILRLKARYSVVHQRHI